MVILKITPACANPTPVLVSSPSMQALYAVLRGLPFDRIDVHGTFTHPGPAGIDYVLPEDERKLVAHLLAESDKGGGADAPDFPVAGAYGRRYIEPEQAARDWNAGLDFRIVHGPDAGRYCSNRDAALLMVAGHTHVSIRLEIPPHAVRISLESGK